MVCMPTTVNLLWSH